MARKIPKPLRPSPLRGLSQVAPPRILPLLIGGAFITFGISGFLLAAGVDHSPVGVLLAALFVWLAHLVWRSARQLFSPIEADEVVSPHDEGTTGGRWPTVLVVVLLVLLVVFGALVAIASTPAPTVSNTPVDFQP